MFFGIPANQMPASGQSPQQPITPQNPAGLAPGQQLGQPAVPPGMGAPGAQMQQMSPQQKQQQLMKQIMLAQMLQGGGMGPTGGGMPPGAMGGGGGGGY